MAQYHWQPFLESLDAGFHGVPIDVRLPYLDLRLIHYALALPPMPWLQGKRLLREVARGLIPEAVRAAPKRGMPGLYEARIAQWWAREPAPFVPSAAFAQFVDVEQATGGGPKHERERPARAPQAARAGSLAARITSAWSSELSFVPDASGAASCLHRRVRCRSR